MAFSIFSAVMYPKMQEECQALSGPEIIKPFGCSAQLSMKFFLLIGKGPQTFSTVFTRITGDFGLVAQNPLFENGLLFMILSSSAVPVCDLIKTRIIKLFERKHRCAYIGQS